ncbi:2-phospho-L-lactate guanylyltransferase [Frankia sp. R82]|uniref:2-phospho-L-lactate guanylyltransferase n=1 Tax=Frankia sp. R82 TaxID=2950553 RepID=UPI0020434C99|nr:2-phospho-L-lactate guanylyltransferase [Frankia sp. R82]MCM3887220.1 2-phospho-L-lactate guanylyltransferase [Frankia sp. R82]
MSLPRGEAPWTVLLPLKNLDRAKSRLQRPDRRRLALAMALDTVTAVLANPSGHVGAVVVVSNDRTVGETLTRAPGTALDTRLLIVADLPDQGLNPALRHGARQARRHWPDRPVAAMSADLPALRPAELYRALTAAAAHDRAVLADTAGSGTVLLTTMPGIDLAPRFGPDSNADHRRSGAVDLTTVLGAAVRGLRRDVDTIADLAEALRLGVGPHTAVALDQPAAPHPRAQPVASSTVGPSTVGPPAVRPPGVGPSTAGQSAAG